MNPNKVPYKEFDHFVLRTPLMPFQFFKKLFGQVDTTDETIKDVFLNPLIQEAIFLASPTLFFEIGKWRDGDLDKKTAEKVKLSFCKYLSRMSSRCTPFGIFAGCSLGKFSNHTRIALEKPSAHQKNTRLDMNYLVSLAQDLAKKEHIKGQLLYHINSSLYEVGEKLRYVEYFYLEGHRQHQIVEIDNSPVLQKIIKVAGTGVSLQMLMDELSGGEYSDGEISSFIDEIIESQVLVSSMEPSVSGPPVLDQILEVLRKLDNCEDEICFLGDLSAKLDVFDSLMGNEVKGYVDFSEWLKKQPTTFKLKYLLQTDMEIVTKNCNLDKKLLAQIRQALAFLNKITPAQAASNLNSFKQAFYERYEENEMPLCQVLDIELGIGYLQNNNLGDVNPLIDDLIIPENENPFDNKDLKINSVYETLMAKFLEAFKKGDKVIMLKDVDFEHLPKKWDDLPDTFTVIAELVQEEGGTKIKISNFGGASAANLLGRFCHGDNKLTDFVRTIMEREKELEPDRIIAEIVHLPESRVGNILMRPHLREYELPYLANSVLPREHQIPLQDLYVSVRNNHLVLRSKKHNKEVLPRLTNAHNFHMKAMPIYQFLCDMQTQGKRESIGLNGHQLHLMFDFLPRIEFKNIIIQEARWKIRVEDIEHLMRTPDNAKLLSGIESIRRQRGLPHYVKLTEGDNELLINLENALSIRMLLDSIKNNKEFVLVEYLHWQGGFVKSDEGHFSNQILLSFHKSF